MAEQIAWKCKQGHVLGQVTRNGSNASQLMLYRQAIDLGAEEPEEPQVLGVLDGVGGMYNIQCSVCGAIRDWDPDAEALRRLLQQYEYRRNGQRRREREAG